MSTMGVDIGTSGCKAVVFDAVGQQLAQAYREYPLLSPQPGWAELNSKQVIDSCLEVMSEAAGAFIQDPVTALTVSSQGEAFTPVGSNGQHLHNAMVSSDLRAEGIIDAFVDSFGLQRLYEITGHTPHPLFTLFKLLWLRDNRPDVWENTYKFLCFEDLLMHHLGMEPAIGYPSAGRTMLFDIRAETWSDDILAAIGLSPARLAIPRPSGQVVGTIPPDMCHQLNLAAGAIVAAGGHDQVCGALGAGVTQRGLGMYAQGTVECICMASSEPLFDDHLCTSNLNSYHHAMPGLYATLAYNLSGGNLLQWFRDEWSRQEVAEAKQSGRNVYELILEQIAPQPTDLLVLPYWVASGTPYFDTRTGGAILNLRLGTTRGDVLRALIEGVAMEMRLNLDILERSGLQINAFRGIGGGSRSRRMLQVKADVLGRPITPVAEAEAGCLGAAMLAMAAREGADLAELSAQWIATGEPVEPDPEAAAYYTKRFDLYKQLRPTLKTLI